MKKLKIVFGGLALVLGMATAFSSKAGTAQTTTYSVWNGTEFVSFSGTPDPSDCLGTDHVCIIQTVNGVPNNIGEGIYQF